MLFQGTAKVPDPLRKALTLLSIVAPVRPFIGPVRVTVEVSTRCNFTCLMCPFYSPLTEGTTRSDEGFIDNALVARVIDSAARMGAKIVSFSGRGEPMLHPYFAGIVRLITNRGLESEVFTNGSLLTQRRAAEIIEAGLSTLGVSLVAASPESYAKFHPGVSPDMFQRVLDSLALLQRLKRQAGSATPRLDLRFIALEGSHLEVEKMVNLGIQLGADKVTIQPLRNRSVGDIGTIALNQDEEKMVLDRLQELAPGAAAAGLKANLDEIAVFHRFGPASHTFPCYAGWFDTRVQVDGTVTFCVRCDRIVGNVNDRPLEDFWQDDQYETLRKLAKRPSERSKLGECGCNRCCHFHSNWRISRFLSTFGLAPRINGLDVTTRPPRRHRAARSDQA